MKKMLLYVSRGACNKILNNDASYLKLFLSAVILFLLSGCTKQQAFTETKSISVTTNNIYAWLNLMPGAKHTFNLTGEIKVLNNSAEEIKHININSISIYQNNNLFYKFIPYVKMVNKQSNKTLVSGGTNVYTIGTQQGLKINEKLDYSLPVMAAISILYDDSQFIYKVNNVNIEKVY